MKQETFLVVRGGRFSVASLLGDAIEKARKEEWKVDQVLITRFDPFVYAPDGKIGLVASEAILLCSKP